MRHGDTVISHYSEDDAKHPLEISENSVKADSCENSIAGLDKCLAQIGEYINEMSKYDSAPELNEKEIDDYFEKNYPDRLYRKKPVSKNSKNGTTGQTDQEFELDEIGFVYILIADVSIAKAKPVYVGKSTGADIINRLKQHSGDIATATYTKFKRVNNARNSGKKVRFLICETTPWWLNSVIEAGLIHKLSPDWNDRIL